MVGYMKKVWRIVRIALLVFTMSSSIFVSENSASGSNENVYVGVTFGGDSVVEAEQLIDKVSSYTNLFIVDSWTISGAFNSSAALTEICDYAVKANLSVIVYFSFIYYNYSRQIGNLYNSSTWELYGVTPWHVEWLNQAKVWWGDKFLGVYLYDEPGGKQIDMGNWGGNMTTFTGGRITSFDNTSSYADAANRFTRSLSIGSMQHIVNTSIPNSVTSPVHLFTSDYALYWFDYKTGYSTVFTEIGGNGGTNSKIQQIALCRGAAKAQNKDWGAIITWVTDNPPTPQSGSTMLKDMTMAYNAGAKYVLVFDYQINGQGDLTDDQFNAIKQFWNNIHSASSDSQGKTEGQVALVLPSNYGWGMRNINDKMWGLWPADNKSVQIWDNMNKLTDKYGLNLDIVYDDPDVSIQGLYAQTYLWNSTLNFAAEPSLSGEFYVLVSAVGSVGAVACLSTYWVTKCRKKKPYVLNLQQSNPNQQVLVDEPINTTEKDDLAIEPHTIFSSYVDILDPLFDLLMNLHGEVDWNVVENSLKRCKVAKVLRAKVATKNLNLRNLSSFIRMRQPKDAALECNSLIKLLHSNALVLGSEGASEEAQPKFGALKSAILAYFVLNDVLLGQVLGDEEVGKEKSELANILDDFQQKVKSGLFGELINTLRKKKVDIAIDDSRTLLRKQLNEFLRQN